MIIDRKYAVIKYFVIGFILLIIIIASIFYFTGNEDSKTKYKYKYLNEDQITFASDEQVDDYKIMLERYLEKNKYSDVDTVKFYNRTFKEDNYVYFYCLLDDEFKTLLECKYDKSEEKFLNYFEWVGDKYDDSTEAPASKIPYLEIVDKESYESKKFDEEIENREPDENIDSD